MTERAKYWSDLVAAWQRSGLSQAEFCRQREVKLVTFAWWKRQLPRSSSGEEGRRRERAGEMSGRFVELRLGGGSSALVYEVVLGCGRSIRVPPCLPTGRRVIGT